MGCVQQAVLEFDEAVQAPWRPRLVAVPDIATVEAGGCPARRPSCGSPSPVPPQSLPGRRLPAAGAARPGGRPPRPARRPGCGLCGRGRRWAAGARLRLTRRARRLAVVLALAGGVALGSWIAPLLSGDGGGDLRLAGVSSVVVQPGDTLWSIASSLDRRSATCAPSSTRSRSSTTWPAWTWSPARSCAAMTPGRAPRHPTTVDRAAPGESPPRQ